MVYRYALIVPMVSAHVFWHHNSRKESVQVCREAQVPSCISVCNKYSCEHTNFEIVVKIVFKINITELAALKSKYI
jgi:hypothetical protein